MTPAQTNFYFFEWGRVRKHYRAKGIDPKQADAKRHDLHRKALGSDKSSKDFNNSDLDRVIAAFRAVYDGGNLAAQLAQFDQPENRRQALIQRCWKAVRSFIQGRDQAHTDALCQRYLDGTSDRMFGVPFVRLYHGQEGNPQLAKVMGALERTARVRKAKATENPF